MLSGKIICIMLEQAEEESKKPTREKMCLGTDSQHIPVIYDDNEDEYGFAEVTEENCWIIKNLIDGRYFTASTEFMQEYELLENEHDEDIPKLNTSPLGSDIIKETFWQKNDEIDLTSKSRILSDGKLLPKTPRPQVISEKFGSVEVMGKEKPIRKISILKRLLGKEG